VSEFVTSPTLPTNDVVTSLKGFSDTLTMDLTDEEIQRAMKTVLPIISKWQRIFRSKMGHNALLSYRDVEDMMKDVDKFEDEVKTTFMEKMDLLVTVDIMPVLEGTGYPAIVFEGALSSHSTAKYGMDHEKKSHEVRKAKDLGEVFLGADNLE
jgi:hypothetical protein